MRRVHFTCNGGGEQPFKVYLRRITDSKAVEITPEMLTPIVEASHDADYRRDIMKYMRECLSEPSGKRWHRIYAGMLLVEKLLDKGSHYLVVELAHGFHFDLIQKVSLLEHFDSVARGISNPWAQDMVRKKASDLRCRLIPMLENATSDELPQDSNLSLRDCVSTCSPGGNSVSTLCSTAASSGGGSSLSSSPATSSLVAGRSALFPRKKRDSTALVGSPEVLAAMSPRSRLQRELKRITDSGILDIPPEFLTYVIKVSRDAESCQVILQHVRTCLEMKGRWLRVHASMVLIEVLLEKGSPQFDREVSLSGDFNLVRCMWQMQEFEYRVDWRAQNLVRKKARTLHDMLVESQLKRLDAECPAEEACEQIGEAFSTLRVWAHSGDLSAPSETSSRPCSDDVDSDTFDDIPKAVSSDGHTPPHHATSKISVNTQASCEDTFFTPMQTPACAPARALPRPPHLLSL